MSLLHTFLRKLLISMTITLVVLELLETLDPGFVSNFMNINYLIAATIAIGIGTVIIE